MIAVTGNRVVSGFISTPETCPFPIVFMPSPIANPDVEHAGTGECLSINTVVVIFIKLSEQIKTAHYILSAESAGLISFAFFRFLFKHAQQTAEFFLKHSKLRIIRKNVQDRLCMKNSCCIQHE